MKNVLDFIEAQLLKNKTHLSNTKISDVLFSYWMGYGVALTELKREILNEAVVCGSETYQTDCKVINCLIGDEEKFGKYCIKCNRQFDKFGKEISS
jgi:hypothetical protein